MQLDSISMPSNWVAFERLFLAPVALGIKLFPVPCSFTTPHFRSPEMVDLYSGLPLDERVDIWVS